MHCLAIAVMACAPAFAAGDRVFAPDDANDLAALVARGEQPAAERITARFDALIDALIDATLARARSGASDDDAPDKNAKSRPKRGKTGHAKERKGGDDDALAVSDDPDFEAKLTSSAAAWRLSQLVADESASQGAALWNGFSHAPEFAQALAFTFQPKRDKLDGVRATAVGLLDDDGKLASRFPELAAAICVVFDHTGVGLQVNEHRAMAPSAELVWRYYVNNADAMRFGVRIAPELLVHVVDVSASPDEIAWALKNFDGIQRVGALYSKVQYDFESLQGKPKKSDVAGWNLPNIYRFGGICADQAYFTVTVAKALGIPAAYTTGANSESAHAWAGFVQASGKKAFWDSEGRYDSYRGVTGHVPDPQTGERMADAVMPMLVQWGLEPAKDRLRAATLRTVDERIQMRGTPAKGKDADPRPLDGHTAAKAREAVLRAALRHAPTDVRSWLRVRDLGGSGELDTQSMNVWFGDIIALCGDAYPEMVLEVAAPMIRSVKDSGAQHDAWMKLATVLAKRADLAGQALLADAAMWRKAGENERAGQAYETLLKTYPNAGPPVEAALRGAGEILRGQRDGKRLLALYDQAFSRIKPPEFLPGLFGRDSTWYRVGKRYVAVLREAGRGGDASTLDARLERTVKIAGDAGAGG